MIYAEKMLGITGMDVRGYVEALEEERRKIQVFQRELPLCLELVTQAIDSCKQQLSGTTTEYLHGGHSESSDQTSSERPVLEEFIPMKKTDSSDFEDEEEPCNKSNKDTKKAGQADWLRSAQLWNQTPDPPIKEDHVPKKATVVEVKRKSGGAFQPFHRDNKTLENTNKDSSVSKSKSSPSSAPAAATSSTAETGSGGSNIRTEKEGQHQRKQRRCWSPELHLRFLHALQQLGGSDAATPKQIRDLMKVDGLTNDEVKSHLQKYRLHTRRPSPTIPNNATQQAPQFVVVGGIWVPAVAATSGEAAASSHGVPGNRIYAPVAAPPPSSSLSQQISPSEERVVVHSTSPATSSSTHTPTAS